MGEVNRVVARFLDGTTVKGTTDDFYPNRSSFHLHEPGSTSAKEVKCSQLKALFFVRDLVGDAARQDVHGFTPVPAEASKGKKIVVQFRDGEILSGFTLAYTPDRSGFFVLPADSGSNNLRVYVFKHAAQKIAIGPNADTLAQKRPGKAA